MSNTNWGYLIAIQIAELVKTMYVIWCLQTATVLQYSKRLELLSVTKLLLEPKMAKHIRTEVATKQTEEARISSINTNGRSRVQRTALLQYYSIWQKAGVTKSNTAEELASWLFIVNGHRQTRQQHRRSRVRRVSGLLYQGVVTKRDVLSEIQQSYWWAVWSSHRAPGSTTLLLRTPDLNSKTGYPDTHMFRGISQSTIAPVGLTVNSLNPFLLGTF